MARPRLVTDEVILEKAYELIMQDGPSKLTFESLGAQVGLVPAALVRRFKNKQHLIIKIDQYALERSNKRLADALAKTASPLEAIVVQFVAELEFASSVDRFANGQEFLLMDLREQALYDNYRDSFRSRHALIVGLLQQAVARGELKNVTDYDELARHLELIAHGAGHVWAMTRDGAIETYISHHILFALRPYKQNNKGD